MYACMYVYIGMSVCEQLPGANSSSIVTKLRQSYPWPQGTSLLNFGRSDVKVGGGGMRSTERPSSYTCISLWLCVTADLIRGLILI